MPKAPPVLKEQRRFRRASPDRVAPAHDRRDDRSSLRSGQPGDADADLKEQGRQGDRRQYVSTVHGRRQDRQAGVLSRAAASSAAPSRSPRLAA